MPDSMVIAEWRAEFERLGDLDCKFVCPNCGLTSSPNDFGEVGAHPERAAKECIGRHISERGCDWAPIECAPLGSWERVG